MLIHRAPMDEKFSPSVDENSSSIYIPLAFLDGSIAAVVQVVSARFIETDHATTARFSSKFTSYCHLVFGFPQAVEQTNQVSAAPLGAALFRQISNYFKCNTVDLITALCPGSSQRLLASMARRTRLSWFRRRTVESPAS
jgi:hypothetical protein